MNFKNYSKVYKSLEKGKFFSTIWCTLDNSCISFLQKVLQPLTPYCDWLSTFGDKELNSKYLPHISLRYLGFTDELDRSQLLKDKGKFTQAISDSKVQEIELSGINIWEQSVDNNITVARLNWKILDLTPLKLLHAKLLEIPGYQFFEDLEGKNYNPHISLGQITLQKDNYRKVKEYLNKQSFEKQKFNLEKFAINYASQEEREELEL